MEILSYLQAHGHYGEIIHGSVKDVAARIRALKSAYQAKANLKGKKLGLIGDPLGLADRESGRRRGLSRQAGRVAGKDSNERIAG